MPSEPRIRGQVVSGDLRGTLFLLALPVLAEQLLSFCVGLWDTFLSGRVNTTATSAVGLAAYVSWLASMIYSLVGTGTTALVARHWGAGEFDEANRIATRSMTLATVLGVLAYAFIFLIAPVFAALLGMEGETQRVVVRYLRIDGAGHLFTSWSLIGAAALRGSGDMRTPMLVLGVVNVLNILVSTACVYGFGPFPRMGIDGIVTGTVVARICGGLLMAVALFRGFSGLKLLPREFWTVRHSAGRILRIGGPAGLDGAIMFTGQFLFLMIIARLSGGRFEGAIFAAHIIGVEVEAISYLPAVAWGYAAATMVGQSLGAGLPDRARRAGHEAVRQCGLFAAVLMVLFFVGAPRIYAFMHTDPEVARVGVPAFRLMAAFQIPLAALIIYINALRGAGDTRYPLLFTILGVLLVRVPTGYVCGVLLNGGLVGAWIGMGADVYLRALLATVRYTRGKWIHIRV